MKSRRVMNGAHLIAALDDPSYLKSLTPLEFSELVRLAQWEVLLGRLAVNAKTSGVLQDLDPVIREVLEDAIITVHANQVRMRYETTRILRALEVYGGPVILLKGLAYLAHALPGSEGRFCTDVDILVPRSALSEVEEKLRHSGWVDIKTDSYDERYYREWMHELPPLRHHRRGVVLDIHHTVTPLTARLKPDAARLISGAIPSQWTGLKTLVWEDMVLHSCIHLFADGDFVTGLRGLYDIRDLLQAGRAQNAEFDVALLHRARLHGVTRPLSYAVRFLRTILGVDEFRALEEQLRPDLPSWMILKLMDWLGWSIFINSSPWKREKRGIAGFLLFLRSHWIKMPPLLLLRHLTVKLFKKSTA